MSKELALDQLRRDGGAVDFDERSVAARAGRVDGPGQQFLADAGFAEEEHRGVGRTNLAHIVHDGCQGFAVAQDFVGVV